MPPDSAASKPNDRTTIEYPTAAIYDELLTVDGARPYASAVHDWVQSSSLDELRSLSDQAGSIMYRKGVTFTVYSDASNVERIIPFDLVPRIITAQDWELIERGCAQRITALNAFIHDTYHSQKAIKQGIVPPEYIFTNPCYEPWMQEIDLASQVYSAISGIDLIRDNEGNWLVLEDNLRTPSGVSYMLESRKLSEQLLSPVFDKYDVEPIAHYPELLRQTLAEISGLERPQIVVLTPGRFNSAYYEHAFLASSMNVPLVHGYDLRVLNNKVFIMTVNGRVQVDVIYRRLDDDFLDPLAFNSSTILGVPGLMSAYRAGNVVITNAPGTGIADDKSVYPYVPDMIRYYLGEEPILQNVPTYQCRDPKQLDHVLKNLSELVVKETRGSGGYGMLIGPKSSKEQIDDFARKIKANPSDYIAQPTISLSTCPTLVDEGVAPRHIDLRPFVLASGDKVRSVPGGLTRVAMKQGSLVVNSSQGGGVKDTWVLKSSPEHLSFGAQSKALTTSAPTSKSAAATSKTGTAKPISPKTKSAGAAQ